MSCAWCALGVLLVSSLIVAGCSESEPNALPEKDLQSWRLPLDDYGRGVPILEQHARQVLVSVCMAELSLSYPVIPFDHRAPGPVTANEYGRRLFSVELASVFGYHNAPTGRFDRSAVDTWQSQAESVAHLFPEEMQRCTQQASSQLGLKSSDLAARLSFSVDVTTDERVVDATERWRECMVAFDDSVTLTEFPGDMPSADDAELFGLYDFVQTDSVSISEQERRLALADATCRHDSGFDQAWYEAEWESQVALMEENSDSLEGEREYAEQDRARILEVLAEWN